MDVISLFFITNNSHVIREYCFYVYVALLNFWKNFKIFQGTHHVCVGDYACLINK